MNKAKQKLLLDMLLGSPDALALCEHIVQPEYFDPDLRQSVELVKHYFKEYKHVPEPDVVAAETGVVFSPRPIDKQELQYVVNELEKFCRHKAIVAVIRQSADYLDKEDFGGLEIALRSAIDVGVVKDVGISLFDDPTTILAKIALSEKPISTGYDDVDKHLFGGLIRKQLFVVSGPSGGGKSLTMNNLALNYVESGHTVLFVSLEMSQELNYLRLSSMITGMGLNGWQARLDEMVDGIERYQAAYGGGSQGQLFIKRLPMMTKPSQIRALIKEFSIIHDGIVPDVVVVDYMDIMMSDVKVPMDNISLRDKYIAEGLREIAHDYNLIMITGSQLTKTAQTVTDVDATHAAGGQTKLNTVDVWGSIILTDEMKAAGIGAIKWIKTRTSDGKNKISYMKYDPISMRLKNFDNGLSDQQRLNFRALFKQASKSIKSQTGVDLEEDMDDPQQEARTSVRALLNKQLQFEGD